MINIRLLFYHFLNYLKKGRSPIFWSTDRNMDEIRPLGLYQQHFEMFGWYDYNKWNVRKNSATFSKIWGFNCNYPLIKWWPLFHVNSNKNNSTRELMRHTLQTLEVEFSHYNQNFLSHFSHWFLVSLSVFVTSIILRLNIKIPNEVRSNFMIILLKVEINGSILIKYAT